MRDVASSDEERALHDYQGQQDEGLEELRQAAPVEPIGALLHQVEGLRPYENTVVPQITHIPVYQQNKEGHCGFYMMHNAKTFVRALLAQNKLSQLVHLSRLRSGKEYTKSFLHTTQLLLAIPRNSSFMTAADRKDIEEHDGSLEREHVKYLLGADSELISLMQNSLQVPVFFAKIEYSMGNLQGDRDTILHLDEQIRAFFEHQGQAIFVFFVGVVNHWITVVVKKPNAHQPIQVYLLDSSNVKHLDKPEEALDSLSVESRCWKKIRVGLKPTIKFMVEMSIYCLFDQRNLFAKLCLVFNQETTIAQVFTSCQVNYMLKEFHLQTEFLNPNATNEL